MRFLIDARLPPALCGWSRERGQAAMHVSEIGLPAASDAMIAARAEAEGETLVTKDEGFRCPTAAGSVRAVVAATRERDQCGVVGLAGGAVGADRGLLGENERFVEVR